MTVLKCKMCGGDLELIEGVNIAECEFCGTTQTVPNINDDKKANLFSRANRLRFGNEFDKAAGIYESIVAEWSDEAEGYWGLCLCKYGIEYVDDPMDAKKVPTCHRTSYESIFDDANFKSAMEKAQGNAGELYKKEAEKIDDIQKKILAIAKEEAPFDVFICYKETDDNGERTKDSILAQDIYYALTDKGYKVFFSRITLEDKLGQEYEPYIFSALNSAKVMLVIGTRYEYFNAIWVKNEWSRFLELMKNDREKMLIPCYRDIDAYDMPTEFSNLQGQDMGKIGFLQDLMRGIQKVIPLGGDVINAEKTKINQYSALTKRGYLYLEDRDFVSAYNYFQKALDENPEDSEAYLGMVMANINVQKVEELANKKIRLDKNKDYEKAIRFASKEKSIELQKIMECACGLWFEDKYSIALEDMGKAKNLEDFSSCEQKFLEIVEYKDSRELAVRCKEKINQIDYGIKSSIYREADKEWKLGKKKKDLPKIRSAYKKFKSISEWEDSDARAKECEELYFKLYKDQENGNRRKVVLIILLALVLYLAFLILYLNS